MTPIWMFWNLNFKKILKKSEIVSNTVCLTLWDPMDGIPLDSLSIGFLQILGWVAIPPPGDRPILGITPEFPALKADYLPYEPLRKPKKILDSSEANNLIISVGKRGPDYINTLLRFTWQIQTQREMRTQSSFQSAVLLRQLSKGHTRLCWENR